VGPGHGQLDPARHFVARAIGNSMNAGKQPVQDGDYLLLELLDSTKAGSITGSILVIERQGEGSDDQYLLRGVHKNPNGRYILKATNPEYPDYEADEGMRTLARLRAVLTPEDFVSEPTKAMPNPQDPTAR
jgi:SOS-response transcriptional repressor LexA